MENILNWYQHKVQNTDWSSNRIGSLLSLYNNKMRNLEFYRLGVMAFILLVQANILVPVTLLAISMNGVSSLEFGLCATFSFGILVALLGGAPVKVTIPLFIVSTVIHLYIILSNFI